MFFSFNSSIAQWPKRTRTSLERLIQPHAPNQNQNNDSNHQQPIANNEFGANSRTLTRISSFSPQPETINSKQESNNLERTNLTRSSNLTNTPKLNASQPIGVVSAAVPALTDAAKHINSSLTTAISGSDTFNPSSTSKNSTSLSDNDKILIDDKSSNRSDESDNGKKLVPETRQRQQETESQNHVQTEENTGIISLLMKKLGQESCPPIPPNLGKFNSTTQVKFAN